MAAVTALFHFGCASQSVPKLAPPAPPADAWAADAALAHARGDLDLAAELYGRALAVDPGHAALLVGLTRVEIDREAWIGAVALDDVTPDVAGADRLSPRERCRMWMGAAQRYIEAEDVAALALVERIRSEPACPKAGVDALSAQAHTVEAESARSAGDPAGAIAAYAAAVEADPERIDGFVAAGRLLLDEGRTREALAWLGDGLERHPDALVIQLLMLEALGLPNPTMAAD